MMHLGYQFFSVDKSNPLVFNPIVFFGNINTGTNSAL